MASNLLGSYIATYTNEVQMSPPYILGLNYKENPPSHIEPSFFILISPGLDLTLSYIMTVGYHIMCT